MFIEKDIEESELSVIRGISSLEIALTDVPL